MRNLMDRCLQQPGTEPPSTESFEIPRCHVPLGERNVCAAGLTERDSGRKDFFFRVDLVLKSAQ